MSLLNQYGKKYFYKFQLFSGWGSIYFEQSYSYYKKYLSFVKEAFFKLESLEELKRQRQMNLDYINDLNSGAIILNIDFPITDIINFDYIEGSFDICEKSEKLGIIIKGQLNREKLLSILREYEKLYGMIGCLSERARKEVIYTANILKINDVLGNFKSSNAYLFSLAEKAVI